MPEPAHNTDREREEQLFYRVLDLPASDRAAFLAQECATAPILRRRLAALLTAHDSSSGFLEHPAAARLPADPELMPGAQVGRYALIREIGEGGSGVVFHARQLEPIQRDVALKVIKLGMDTREVVARFEAERQALALLDHPGIAHVLDAGATESGRPFFVMELVSGAPITRYADAHRLGVRARVELLVQVCAALEHAHQKGVIHRDLKPSNILVAQVDGAARPKVIDFGVAKATSDLRGRTLHTAPGTFIGTPGYLSPEQAESGHAAVDTRSDVYGLGALAYELLAGSPPFGRVTGPDFLRRLRDEEPPRPSHHLRSLAESVRRELATARGLPPEALVREVHGDLDWIVLKCLERDPARRYATVNELAADLQRHLAFAPVRARPPSRRYVLGRLMRRHRALSAVVVVSVLMLAGATAVSLRYAWLAARAERAAQEEMTASRQMAAFLQDDLLAPAAQEAQPVWDLRWRAVLDRAAGTVETRFHDRPVLAARMHATLGANYRTLGDYPAAQHHYERAWYFRRLSATAADADRLALADNLSAVLHAQNRWAAAERLWLGLDREFARPDAAPADRLHVWRQLSATARERRDFPAALAQAERALALARTACGPEHEEFFRSQESLALVHSAARRLPEAIAAGESAVAGLRRTRGADDPLTLAAALTLADILRFADRLDEAEGWLRDVIARRTRTLGADHPGVTAAQTALAFVYQEAGRFDDALALARQEAGRHARLMGPEHPITLGALTNLGFKQQLAGHTDDAVATHRQVLAIRERINGPQHLANSYSHFGIGVALRVGGQAAAAEPGLRRAADLRRALLGPQHRETLVAASEHGLALAECGRYTESAQVLHEATTALAATDPDAWTTAVTRSRLGAPLIALGRYVEAEHHLLAAHARLTRDQADPPPNSRSQVEETVQRLVRLYSLWGRPAEAAQWTRRTEVSQRH